MQKPKQIRSPEELEQALSCVHTAMQLLGNFDWDEMVRFMILFEMAGDDIDSTINEARKADKNWDAKKRLYLAAATFVREVVDIRENTEPPDPAAAAINRLKAGL